MDGLNIIWPSRQDECIQNEQQQRQDEDEDPQLTLRLDPQRNAIGNSGDLDSHRRHRSLSVRPFEAARRTEVLPHCFVGLFTSGARQ
ncbi:hypothetical protein ACVWWO_003278 [Bradyrhizobium sp. F1.13.1]